MTPEQTVSVDYETFYDTKSEYSLATAGGKQLMSVWEYLHDDRFRAYWVGIHAPDVHYSGPVETAPWDRLVGRPLCSHNAAFDEAINTLLQKQGKIPVLHTPAMYDTIDAVRYLQQPAQLGRAVQAILGKTHDKGFRAVMNGKHLEDLDADQRVKLAKYGADDAKYCWELMAHTLPTWPLAEQRISTLNRNRGVEGLTIDQVALDAAIEVMQLAHFNLLKNMPWVARGSKPLSVPAMREQGRMSGIPVPASLKLGDTAAILWENTYAKQFPWVAAVRGFRRVNSMLKKLQTWRKRIRPDGTAPFQLKYFGAAATGRFSGGGGFNIQNLGKKPMVVCKECWNCNLEYLDEDEEVNDGYEIDDPCKICGSPKRFVIDIRGMILAAPGRSLIIADYSQIEARLLLWRAGDTAMLDRIRKGFHIYEAYAREHLGWTREGKMKQDESPEGKTAYSLAKALVLGGGYQCWVKGFVRAAKDMAGLTFTEKEALPHVQGYRVANPKIVKYWDWHQKWMAHSAIMKDPVHEVELASGRTVRYFNPQAHTDAKGRASYNAEIVAGDSRMRRWFFGGKLTENEMQATARDVMRDGILEAEDRGIPTHFTVHDELITSVPTDQAEDAKRELENLLPTAAKWALDCPLGVEVKISDRYIK